MRWRVALAGALAVASGCERAVDRSRGPLEPWNPPGYVVYARQPDPPTAIEPQAFSTCVPSITPGRHEVEHNGHTRAFVVDLPDVPDGAGPRPLLFAFHGWGGDPEQLEGTTKIASIAASRGYVVVRPLGFNKSFDGGTCCGLASETHVDDVGLARVIITQLAREACVDAGRVYATGFSNGGFLAHRLGCEAADVFTAVASVAGTLGIERCAPSRPVSVLHIHGKADGIVAFAGNSAKGWRSVATTMDSWTRTLHCRPDAADEVFVNGSARCVRNAACDEGAEATLCRDDKAAHTWPGGPRSFGFGGSQDLDATETILAFFGRHAREPSGLGGPTVGGLR